MKKIILFLIIFLNTTLSFAASEDFIIAKINNKAITKSELYDRYKFVLFVSKITIKTTQDQKVLLDQILDKMIDEELIRQNGSSLKIDVASDEIRDVIDEIATSQKKNATQLKLSIINHGISFDNYLNQVESEVLWSKVISEVLRPKVKITDVEIKEFFEQQKLSTDVKQFYISEIFIPKSENAKLLSEKLVGELRQGADFKVIVRQFSRSLSSDNNGEIGWVSNRDIDPKIHDAIAKVPINSYSNPVEMSDGFFIFKVTDKRNETKIHEQDLAAAKNIIFSHKIQTLSKGYLMDLKKKAFVEKSF
jgi:peptidyl-prolyl cis-trans isomerase SurA